MPSSPCEKNGTWHGRRRLAKLEFQNDGRLGLEIWLHGSDQEAESQAFLNVPLIALTSVVDRTLRMKFIERILPSSIENMEQAFLRIKARYPEMRTITTDNDLLFAKHEQLAKLLNVTIYFCHPYSSWEKGTVENANKAIRQFIPKGSDISKYSQRFIERLEQKLNDRPMKCLEYRTPNEAMAEHRRRKNKKRPKWRRSN